MSKRSCCLGAKVEFMQLSLSGGGGERGVKNANKVTTGAMNTFISFHINNK
jgi:hypothetical protein